MGKVIPIRFYDTRHTTASLLMMFGANPAAMQRVLRHSDIRVTMDLYGTPRPEIPANLGGFPTNAQTR